MKVARGDLKIYSNSSHSALYCKDTINDLLTEAEMKHALLILADGFEEIEAVTPIDLLRRAGVEVTIAALRGREAIGARSITISADVSLENVINEDFDIVILPGGGRGADNLAASETVLSLLKQYKQNEKKIAAICAAPKVLLKAGILQNVAVTSFPSFAMEFDPKFYRTNSVVTDGNVTTSRGAGTAMLFSLELVKILVGDETVNKLKEALVIC